MLSCTHLYHFFPVSIQSWECTHCFMVNVCECYWPPFRSVVIITEQPDKLYKLGIPIKYSDIFYGHGGGHSGYMFPLSLHSGYIWMNMFTIACYNYMLWDIFKGYLVPCYLKNSEKLVRFRLAVYLRCDGR